MERAQTFGNQVWQRLRRKKLAMAGLIFISALTLVAAFAYLIAPDNTPNADRQTLEIQAKKPGYVQSFLRIPREVTTRPGLLARLISGRPDASEYIPISRYRLANDSIYIERFIDEDTVISQAFLRASIDLNSDSQVNHNLIKKKYWLGTDTFGRDILSRLIIGTRITLAVGLIAVFVSLFIGVLLGAIAGYYGGRIDATIVWFINVTWSIPTLLLVFAITIAAGKGFWQIFIAIGLTMWVSVARLVRSQVLAIREREYIQAAKALGFKDSRIIFRHILPNIAGPLLVISASNFATAIIIEAGLSFLGIGIQPPQPSWGLMIKENYNFIITHNPLLALLPGFAIMVTVLAFNVLGNGLRDAVDVKDK